MKHLEEIWWEKLLQESKLLRNVMLWKTKRAKWSGTIKSGNGLENGDATI